MKIEFLSTLAVIAPDPPASRLEVAATGVRSAVAPSRRSRHRARMLDRNVGLRVVGAGERTHSPSSFSPIPDGVAEHDLPEAQACAEHQLPLPSSRALVSALATTVAERSSR
jgi:hypothetical protein